MRASLGNFRICTFYNCYFFHIFRRYFRYSVGTNDMLVGYMYRQISKCTDKTPKKHYWGGGRGKATLMDSLKADYATDHNLVYLNPLLGMVI